MRYEPIDLDVVLRGTDIRLRWPTSRYSFDWNVTHRPSQSGIWPDWLGDNNFAIRERGWCAGRVIPRHALWSRTNCSVVTASFSQFKIVASSILPRLTDAQDANRIIDKMGKKIILMFSIIIYLPFWGNSFYNVKKERRDKVMAINVQQFIKLANYYNQTAMLMSAICVQKGGIAMENYVGRFYVADVLEYVVEYGRRLKEYDKNLAENISQLIDRFAVQFEQVRGFVTPTQKPLHEMTLAEFERVMNI